MVIKIGEIISANIDGVRIANNARKVAIELDKLNILPKWYSIIDKYMRR